MLSRMYKLRENNANKRNIMDCLTEATKYSYGMVNILY